MSRELNGTSGQLIYPIPASGGTNPGSSAWSALLVMKVMTSSNVWMSLMEVETSGGNLEAGFGHQPGAGGLQVWYESNAAWEIGHNFADTDGWMVLGVSKPVGTANAIGHKCVIGGTNTHTTAANARPDPASCASGNLRIGGNADFAPIRVAAAAFWVGTSVANATFDTIASTKTTAAIQAASPTWLVDDSDDLVNDLVGTQDKGSEAGATHSTDNPSGWVFGVGAPAVNGNSLISGGGVPVGVIMKHAIATRS